MSESEERVQVSVESVHSEEKVEVESVQSEEKVEVESVHSEERVEVEEVEPIVLCEPDEPEEPVVPCEPVEILPVPCEDPHEEVEVKEVIETVEELVVPTYLPLKTKAYLPSHKYTPYRPTYKFT